MRINNNITAENSHRQLGLNHRKLGVNVERLSSGLRVNRAADDAAGLAISEKMRTQIRGLNRASLNIQDGASLLQVGDGALQSVHDKMQRMRELAVQAANDTNQLIDREAIQLEFGQLTSEINAVVSQTNFNGRHLFDGSIGAAFDYNLGRVTAPFISTIHAADPFNAPVNVPGWSAPATFGVRSTGGVDIADPGFPGFPDSGYFAMQLVTPVDGFISVVLDFGAVPINNHIEFLDFFTNEFNRLAEVYGLVRPGESIVNGIGFDQGTGHIIFDFPSVDDPADPSRQILTGVMGRPGTLPVLPIERPRVHIGLGGPGLDDDNVNQINSLNRISSPNYLGPFISNRPPNAPLLTPDSFSFANERILGDPEGYSIPTPGTRAMPPSPPSDFPTLTVTIDGRPTTINLAPGRFDSIDAFVAANREAFENAVPRGTFELGAEDGRLVITARSSTDGEEPNVTFVLRPSDLAGQLGFPGDVDTQAVIGGLWIQSGANEGDGIIISIPRLCTRSLGVSIRRPEDVPDDTGELPSGLTHINVLGADGYTTTANVAGNPREYSLSVTSHERASAALAVLDNAINIISMERAQIGAQHNRLEFARANVDNTGENLQAAESRIRDTDMAAEMTIFVRNQILTQSSTAMLAQANALPQGMLQLLG